MPHHWATHLSVIALVILWLLPTFGLLISSFRTVDQLSASGWWKSMFKIEQTITLRTASAEAQYQQDGLFIISGNLFIA